jgi:hypothetical protein
MTLSAKTNHGGRQLDGSQDAVTIGGESAGGLNEHSM